MVASEGTGSAQLLRISSSTQVDPPGSALPAQMLLNELVVEVPSELVMTRFPAGLLEVSEWSVPRKTVRRLKTQRLAAVDIQTVRVWAIAVSRIVRKASLHNRAAMLLSES
jgi:hypothetical protein